MRVLALILALCLCLTGCNAFMDGAYEWEASHPIDDSAGTADNVSVANYQQLIRALERLVEIGAQQGTVIVADYPSAALETDVQRAISAVRESNPIAAYAVEEIRCDLGTSGSQPALAVQVKYLLDKAEIRKIKHVADNEEAWEVIRSALMNFDTGIVMLVEAYQETDLVQLIEDYAVQYPQYVMEQPQVLVNFYPEEGKTRVVEMRFSYQTSRDSLKSMQSYVETLFDSAMGFVSGDIQAGEKYAQLYGFLMARFTGKVETAITLSYHLLRHGVGDSRAFALVYGAMCRQAELSCFVVSGTRNGEPWYWNIVEIDGVYYHVDLLKSQEQEDFFLSGDAQMEGYVWDFTAYPPCGEPLTETE